MRNILKKILVILCLSILLTTSNLFIYNYIYANESSDPVNNPDYWIPNDLRNVEGATKLESLGNKIIGAIQTFGSIITAIFILVLGIKYIVGSAEEKADYKTSMKPFLIGSLLIFGIVNVLGLIMDVVSNINS